MVIPPMDNQLFLSEIEAMERSLYRVSRSLLPSAEECADAVQEALTKAWSKLNTVQPEHFRPWLMRIVINECHNISRRKKRVVLVAEIELPQGAEQAPNEDLREAIAALPERLRLPLLLHYLEGFSVEETAKMLRLPAGTVKSRLHHARLSLRAQLLEVQA